MRVIYMIGHSKHRIGDFLGLLQRYGIGLLVDVRSRPLSRWCPQFNRDKLYQVLQNEGIAYRWLPALGGLNPSPPATMLETLTSLFNDQRTMALMCSEGDFRKCHRHHLLAPLVQSLGCQVQQITPTGALVADPGPTGPTQQHRDDVPDDAQGLLEYSLIGKGE